jgi:hypothetical protein
VVWSFYQLASLPFLALEALFYLLSAPLTVFNFLTGIRTRQLLDRLEDPLHVRFFIPTELEEHKQKLENRPDFFRLHGKLLVHPVFRAVLALASAAVVVGALTGWLTVSAGFLPWVLAAAGIALAFAASAKFWVWLGRELADKLWYYANWNLLYILTRSPRYLAAGRAGLLDAAVRASGGRAWGSSVSFHGARRRTA